MKNDYTNLIGTQIHNWKILNIEHNNGIFLNCECQCEFKTKRKITLSRLNNGKQKMCIKCGYKKRFGEDTYIEFDNYYVVKITNGEIKIDKEDLNLVKQYKWYIDKDGYAQTTYKTKNLKLHRILSNCPSNLLVDHINRIRTDNRKENLRICFNRRINSINKGIQCNNKSGYAGVIFNKGKNKWQSSVWLNNKRIHLGYFNDIVDAVKAREKGEEIYYQPIINECKIKGMEVRELPSPCFSTSEGEF